MEDVSDASFHTSDEKTIMSENPDSYGSITNRPSHPSPAEQVFAISELLEMILLEYIKQNAQPEGEEKMQMSPLRGLFALQRVNKNFQEYIRTCKKCRRFMFIDPPSRMPPLLSGEAEFLQSNDQVNGNANMRPIRWLLETFGTHHPSESARVKYLPDSREAKFLELSVPHSDEFARRLPPRSKTTRDIRHSILQATTSGMRRKEASWRRMKAFRSPCEPATIYQCFRLHDIDVWYGKSFEVTGETTLGEFWDWYEQSCVMDYQGHKMAYDAMKRCGPPTEWTWGTVCTSWLLGLS